MLLLLRSLLDGAYIPPEPPVDTGTTAAGGKPLRSAPWHWVPFAPVKPRRPRKKRNAAILFLGK